jgi:hypothetical protein
VALDKIELKRAWLQEHGRKLEERESAMHAELSRLQGARGVLKNNLPEIITNVLSVWKQKHEAGEVAKEQLDVASKVCDQLYEAVRSLLQKCEQDAFIKQGEVNSFKFQLDLVESQYKIEGEKAKILLQAIEVNDSTTTPLHSRPVGTHPGYSVADLRRAKESVLETGTMLTQSVLPTRRPRRKKTSI